MTQFIVLFCFLLCMHNRCFSFVYLWKETHILNLAICVFWKTHKLTTLEIDSLSSSWVPVL